MHAGEHHPGQRLMTPADSRADPAVGVSTAAHFPPRIQRYLRDAQLGRGGMGIVFRYFDPRLDRFVAVKTLPEDKRRDPERRQRFEREARALARLDHPNIAQVYDVIEEGGVEFLLMEFVAGRTLCDLLTEGPLPLERALHLALPIGRAIEAGHARDVLHRDIKPANIMVTDDGVPKLLDYGLARWHGMDGASTVSEDETTVWGDDEGWTGHGRMLGTPGYMSPEQIQGEFTDEATDVWAFGCVLYECLAGSPAFPGPPPQRLAATLQTEPDWSALPAHTPRAIRDVLEQCLCKEPSRRVLRMTDACAAIAGVLSDGAGPSARRGVPSNVRTPLTTFIPRAGELERVLELVRLSRLLTITGPGGSGKTRLALEVALVLAREDEAPPCPDGIIFVELAPVSRGELIVPAIVQSLRAAGLLDEPIPSADLDALADLLGARSVLVILDNCEHIAEECRAFAEALLQRCVQLRVVATSRESLGVPGEQSYPVPELSIPRTEPGAALDSYESVRLFVDRAALARPGFTLQPANAPAIAAICRRLDGIPLSIELAAARVRSVPIDQIARRLFEVLDPGRVLESSIAWSVQQLPRPARTMLARLAVFRGGWTMEAAEAVCSDGRGEATIGDAPVIELLTRLVDKSLARYVERGNRARYHLLESVREYCLGHLLDRSGLERLRDRHLEYFMELAAQADAAAMGSDHAPWLDRLEIEHDNLRAAVEHSSADGADPVIAARLACALHRFWYVRGYATEGLRALRRVLERRSGARDLLQAQTLNAAGILTGRHGDFDEASAYCEQALAIVRALGDTQREAGVLTNLGLWAREAWALDRSRAYHEQAMRVYESIGDVMGVAMVQLNLGTLAKLERRDDEAIRLLEAGLPVFREQADQQRIAVVLQNLGEVRYRQGHADAARECFRESLQITRALGERRVTAETLLWFARLAFDAGRATRALHLHAAAEAIFEAAECCPLAAATDLPTTLDDVRARLGESEISAGREAGRRLTFQQAVDLALEDEA